jgi:hypothetical protein
MNPPRPALPILLVTVGLALLTTACSRTKEEKLYDGAMFRLTKPNAGDWVLVSKPQNFSFPPPPAHRHSPNIRKTKVVELTSVEQQAGIEIYLVRPLSAQGHDVMAAILRKHQRRNIVEAVPKAIAVGGRRGQASIAVWRQTRLSPRHYFYCVRVPLADALWCFVGNASEEHFEAARWHFKRVLNSVKFPRSPRAVIETARSTRRRRSVLRRPTT